MIPSLRSPYRALLAGAVAVSGLVLAPQAASAATTCNYNAANHTINVTLSAAWDRAQFKRNADGTLALNGAGCGAATIYDTDAVYFKDVSGQSTTVALDAESGPFAPGYTDEGFGSEIELFVDTGDGDKDSLIVEGEASGASIAVGTQGINLNTAAEPYTADSDVSMSGVDSLTVGGSGGADWISGQGGSGTGQPYAKPLALLGGAGKDELVAGEYAYGDWLMGHGGDDVLVAGSHGDFL